MALCVICREEIVEGCLKTVLYGCGHLYHSNCIMEWALRGNFTCPTCKAEVVDVGRGLNLPSLHKRLYDVLQLAGYLFFGVGTNVLVTVAYTLSLLVRVANTLALTTLTVVLCVWLLGHLLGYPLTLSTSPLCAFTREVAHFLLHNQYACGT
jgi:hypothetical protein